MSTVITLGAGASHSAKFPVGTKLIEQIARKYHDDSFIKILKRIIWNNRGILRQKYSNLIRGSILDKMQNDAFKFYKGIVPEFTEWLYHLPSAGTIDDFIYHRPEFSVFAKLGILAVLSDNEKPEFFEPNSLGEITRTWYDEFWSILRKGCKTAGDLAKKLNRLTIITFNYDRSFDYFLDCSIHSIYKHSLNGSGCLEALKIHHVYGSIGDLLNRGYYPINFNKIPDNSSSFHVGGWENPEFLPPEYGQFIKFDQHILSASLGIKTYNEEFMGESGNKYMDIIQSASYLYILEIIYPYFADEKQTRKNIDRMHFE